MILVDHMQHEATYALYSLRPSYQRGVRPRDYEVIVVENSATQRLRPNLVRGLGQNFRYAVHHGSDQSPAAALNFGVSLARGSQVMTMFDGASILSPGVLRRSIAATRLVERPVVVTLAWRLSPNVHSQSIGNGSRMGVQDRPSDSVDWHDDGYRLFEISSPTSSSRDGWLGPVLASNCITIPREHFDELGGFEPASAFPDSSLASADLFQRVIVDPKWRTILILGEGTFHQFRGDFLNDRLDGKRSRPRLEENSRRGSEELSAPMPQPILFGHMPSVAQRLMEPLLNTASNAQQTSVASALMPMAAPETDASPDIQVNAPRRKVA